MSDNEKSVPSGSDIMGESEKFGMTSSDKVNGSEKPDVSNQVVASDGAKSIIVKHEAPLGWLIINRPQVKNALNFEAWRGLDLLHFSDGKLVQKLTYAKAKSPLFEN